MTKSSHTLKKLIQDSLLLSKEKKQALIRQLKEATPLQKRDLKKILLEGQTRMMKPFEEAKKITDPKFWEKFNTFKKKRIKKMYQDEESDHRKKEDADSILNGLENI